MGKHGNNLKLKKKSPVLGQDYSTGLSRPKLCNSSYVNNLLSTYCDVYTALGPWEKHMLLIPVFTRPVKSTAAALITVSGEKPFVFQERKEFPSSRITIVWEKGEKKVQTKLKEKGFEVKAIQNGGAVSKAGTCLWKLDPPFGLGGHIGKLSKGNR